MIEALLENEDAVFWLAIVVMAVVPPVSIAVTHYMLRTRKAELEASLKMRMLEMGMTAEDIERVITAEGSSVKKDIG
jgi:hypothetical protein